MVRVYIIAAMALGVCIFNAQASCLEEFNAHMDGIFHHGPYQIDGVLRSDKFEGRSEVKFIYPNKISIKFYNMDGELTFGSIDIDDRAWRLDGNGHWIIFKGEDTYSLKNELKRGSGDFKTAKSVACPDPSPNYIDNYTNYQYMKPFHNRNGSYLSFIKFDKTTNLPKRAEFSWSSLTHSGEEVYVYRFDNFIHVDPPTPDPLP